VLLWSLKKSICEHKREFDALRRYFSPKNLSFMGQFSTVFCCRTFTKIALDASKHESFS
jgi:hypothetical protein